MKGGNVGRGEGEDKDIEEKKWMEGSRNRIESRASNIDKVRKGRTKKTTQRWKRRETDRQDWDVEEDG